MPQSTEHKKFTVELGEKLVSASEQVRAYFFYLTPTGETVNIKDSGKVNQITFFKGTDSEAIECRKITIRYEATMYLELRMVCIRKVIGRQREVYTLDIGVGDSYEGEFPKIEVLGIHGFGRFLGHGRVLNEVVPDCIKVTQLEADKESPNMGLIW